MNGALNSGTNPMANITLTETGRVLNWAVLTYSQSEGILHRPKYVPKKLFFQELEFYGLPKLKEKVKGVENNF